MSKDLNQFYREMWTWVQDGCKGHPVFKTHYGLCHNLRRWEAGTNADLIRDIFFFFNVGQYACRLIMMLKNTSMKINTKTRIV